MRSRRIAIIAAAALGFAALAGVHAPSADIRILTHDSGDTAPRRMEAAVDLGIFAVSVLITWTGKRLRGGF